MYLRLMATPLRTRAGEPARRLRAAKILRTFRTVYLAILLTMTGTLVFDWYMRNIYGVQALADNYDKYIAAIKPHVDPYIWRPLFAGVETTQPPIQSSPWEIHHFEQAAGGTLTYAVSHWENLDVEQMVTVNPIDDRTIHVDATDSTDIDLMPIFKNARRAEYPVRSTYLADDRAFGEGEYRGPGNTTIRPEYLTDWNHEYCRLLGIPCGPPPPHLEGKIFTGSLLYGVSPEVAATEYGGLPPMFRIMFHRGGRSMPISFYPHPNGWDRHVAYNFREKSTAAAYWLVQHFASEIKWASERIVTAHPEVHLANAQLGIYSILLGSTVSTANEDPWQDIYLCRQFDCPHTQALEDFFSGKPIGPAIHGIPRNLPWPAWRLASRWFKWHVDTQSFGIYSVHLRYAQLAARDPARLARYSSYLTAADFESDAAIARMLTDPHQPLKGLMTKVMILDYVLSLLEDSTYRDHEMRSPANSPPFIGDRSGAREYALLCSAMWGVNYPETLLLSKVFLMSAPGASCASNFSMLGEIFQVEPRIPGMFDLVGRNSVSGEVHRVQLTLWQ